VSLCAARRSGHVGNEIYEKRNKLEHPTAISTMESKYEQNKWEEAIIILINLKNVS
jgi:hypothetical protein